MPRALKRVKECTRSESLTVSNWNHGYLGSDRKRTRKGGRGRETERREQARVRALKTTQRAHATTMNEWMSEFISERVCECKCVCVSVYGNTDWWWVCVCLYTRVHTHKLLGYLMWAQAWDRHLESQKNPDRLQRSIDVDRISVHSTFVYNAVMQVVMIWANCVFLLMCLFFLEK